MCGIIGVSLNTEKKSLRSGLALFKSLLVENTKRGKDSTGIVYQYKDNTEIFRGFLPGEEAQNYVLPEKDVIGFLGHTRFATVGKRGKYANVHPFETDNYVGVHNGTIFNHKLLKKHFKLETSGECDSEVLYKLMDKFGLEGLKHVEGLYLIAYIHKNRPEELNLLTNGSKPMLLFKLHGEMIAFGSIGDETKDKAEEFWNKLKKKHDFEKIKPCTLYRLHNGKIIERRDLSKKIKYISEEEGELRYKIDYKILKRDLYQMTVPIYRRLLPAKIPTTTIVKAISNNRATTGPGLFDSSVEKCKPCNAKASTIGWGLEAMSNTFKLFESRIHKDIPGMKVAMFSIDTLGTAIHFSNNDTRAKFLLSDIKGEIENEKKLQLKDDSLVMISTFPEDVDSTRVWLANTVQIDILLNSILYAEKLVLYSKQDWISKMPTASQVLAACMCNNLHPETLKKVHTIIKDELVTTGLLQEEIMVLTEDKVKGTFTEIAKKDTTVVFSKKNQILSPYLASRFREKKWYGLTSARKEEKEIFGKDSWKVEDVGLTGRVFFVSEILSRLCERVAMHTTEHDRIYVPQTPVYFNRLSEASRHLYTAFKEENHGYLNAFRDHAMNLREPKILEAISSDFELFEAALKEQVKRLFGNGHFSYAPCFTDIFAILNKNNNSELIVDAVKQNIRRVRLLHEFVVKDEIPDVANKEYKTIIIK